MKTLDLAVIGSGIGGTLISSLNKEKDLILFERDSNLGGCASTFKRYGNLYNAGATTFVGYEKNHPVKDIFDKAGFIPDIKKSEIAIRVLQNNKVLDRVKDFETFLENLNKVYPHKNNRIFWEKIKEVDEKFWELKKLHYAKYSLDSYKKTASSVLELFSVFGFDLIKNANNYINETLINISKEYKEFIDAQLLITLQTKAEGISLLSLCIGLAYPFHDVFYSNGGMGAIFDGLLEDINVHKNEEIKKIIKEQNSYKILSNKNEYSSKNIILNSSIYNSSILFEDENIKKYYDKFSFSDQSAFVIYLTLDSKDVKKDFLHHYQIILKNEIPNSISNSFFVSFSSKDDNKLSQNGYSVTISTHTKALFWKDLNKQEYKEQKKITEDFIINHFLENFETIKKEDIIKKFSATSKTFKRYINRYNCGGRAITLKNILQTPSCNTPFKGLYNIGDTVFAGQGWPGIAIGVQTLNKELNAKC